MGLFQKLLTSFTSALLWLEIRRLFRSQRSFWFLLLFLLVLLVMVWQSWGDFARNWAPDGNTALGSRLLFYKLVQGHLFFISIMIPFLIAPAIVTERESETFALLMSSPISILQLIYAKLLSPLLFILLLLISGLPVLSLSFIGGGLSIIEVVRAYLILITASITFSLLGLYCSTLRKRVYEVYLIAVFFILLYALILPFHGNVWHYINTVRFEDMSLNNHGFQFLSPFFALREEIRPSAKFQSFQLNIFSPISSDLNNPTILFTMNSVIVIYIMVSILISLFLLALTYQRIKRIAFENEVEWNIYGTLAKITLYLKSIPYLWQVLYWVLIGTLLIDLIQQINHIWLVVRDFLLIIWVHYLFKGLEYLVRDVEDTYGNDAIDQQDRGYDLIFTAEHSNPGLFLERRVQWFAKSTVLLRLTYLALMLSILLLPLVSYDGAWLFLTLPFIISAFFTLPLASTSVSVDHERGTLDLLRTTLLTNQEIIHAKFITNLQYNFMIAVTMFLPGILILTIFTLFTEFKLDLVYHLSDLFSLLWYPIILFCSLVLYTSVGIFCSSFFMNTNKSLILSGVIVLICLVLPSPLPILNVAMIEFAYGGGFGLSFLSPLGALALVLPSDRLDFFRHTQDFASYWAYLVYIIVIVQCLVSLFVASVLYRKAIQAMQR